MNEKSYWKWLRKWKIDHIEMNINRNYFTVIMLICIKQHLSNIWSSIYEKVKQYWCWVRITRCLCKKACNTFAKIVNGAKTNLKIRQASEMKPLAASEANLESCQTSKMSLSKKHSQKQKFVHYIGKNLHLGSLTRFWVCFWIGSQKSKVS